MRPSRKVNVRSQRGWRHGALPYRYARTDTHARAAATAAADPEAADTEADGRTGAVAGPALRHPGVHLGTVVQLGALRRRAPGAHCVVVARAKPRFLGLLGGSARGEQQRKRDGMKSFHRLLTPSIR